MQKKKIAFVVLMLVAAQARAHYLWVENTGNNAAIYFGGVDEGVREHSPGRLDEIGRIRVQLLEKKASEVIRERQRRIARNHDVILAGEPVQQSQSLLVTEETLPVRMISGKPVKMQYYVRHVHRDQVFPAAMPIDIVPAGKEGAVQLSYMREPLPGHSVRVIAPNGWYKDVRTGSDGVLHIDMRWKGNYVLVATKSVQQSGAFQGKQYEQVRYRIAATVVQDQGVATHAPVYVEHPHDHQH